MNKHDLYERCVQSPEDMVRLLSAIHAHKPEILAEDFAGTAAVSRAWVAAGGKAVAVDANPEPLERARAIEGLRVRVADVMDADDPADIVFVGNFSIGECDNRSELLHYLRHARRRLRPGGVFVCDTYGGESAFLVGHVERLHPGPDGTTIRYTWEQREADPLTARVVDVLHFQIEKDDEILERITDAFTYRWRLWSVPELREALHEAGYARIEVYSHLPEAVDDEGHAHVRPVTDPDELDDSFIVCIAARA
jgi:SAM-dependent methyltransferase